jgi:hypothetical protein
MDRILKNLQTFEQHQDKLDEWNTYPKDNDETDDPIEDYTISKELQECLPYLKTVRREIGFDFGRAGIVHQWFNDNDIEIFGMSDLDMYIMYIEKNSK